MKNLLELHKSPAGLLFFLPVLLTIAVHQDPGIGYCKLNQLFLLTDLRCPDADLFSLQLTQPRAPHRCLRKLCLHPNLLGDKRRAIVILLDKVSQNLRILRFPVYVNKLMISADNLAIPYKENLNDTTSISVEINNENVYCRCPQCGAEVPVDLSVFWTAENFDIFSSAVYCDACTLKRLKGALHESV